MDLQRLLTAPGYSWRRKRHEGDKSGVDGIYLDFDYMRIFFLTYIVTASPPSPLFNKLRVGEETDPLRNFMLYEGCRMLPYADVC